MPCRSLSAFYETATTSTTTFTTTNNNFAREPLPMCRRSGLGTRSWGVAQRMMLSKDNDNNIKLLFLLLLLFCCCYCCCFYFVVFVDVVEDGASSSEKTSGALPLEPSATENNALVIVVVIVVVVVVVQRDRTGRDGADCQVRAEFLKSDRPPDQVVAVTGPGAMLSHAQQTSCLKLWCCIQLASGIKLPRP
ncbi:unnamed protein product [Polarella glacialis]|uniref:Uncharacterized protein n=1 Tax=Polarella glacialis TaxID=89957 RepID=A0A813DMX4_POLGL|nr:unnamed protein product [Polarella glacialis]